MDTPQNIRYLKNNDVVKRGDFIRQGDGTFEYCQEFGSHITIDLRYRKVSLTGRLFSWFNSLFGREGV